MILVSLDCQRRAHSLDQKLFHHHYPVAPAAADLNSAAHANLGSEFGPDLTHPHDSPGLLVTRNIDKRGAWNLRLDSARPGNVTEVDLEEEAALVNGLSVAVR